MKTSTIPTWLRPGMVGLLSLGLLFSRTWSGADDQPAATSPPRLTIDGMAGPGWRSLTSADFQMVNGEPDTWSWEGNAVRCSGIPVGVTRTVKEYGNFELTARWRHLKPGGNSGFFLWAPGTSMDGIKPGQLPKGGIEVQVLDHAYTQQYESSTGKKANWFTTNGDVFPVGTSRMKPFAPTSPDGVRSFPSKNLSRGVNEWNYYYIRAINGEVRLWVNGEEVAGGSNCTPSRGYLCLESEGSPIEFEQLRIRELP